MSRWRHWLAPLAWLFLGPLAQAQPMWLDGLGQLRLSTRQAVQWLWDAEQEGLNPDDYPARSWARAMLDGPMGNPPASEQLPSAWEAELTRDVLHYLQDLRHGRVSLEHLGAVYDGEHLPVPDGPGLAAQLAEAAHQGDLAPMKAWATPPWPHYPLLRDALAQQRALVDDPAWARPLPPLPGGKWLPGQAWAGVPLLLARLQRLGDLSPEQATNTMDQGPELEQALRRFQQRHGLEADGVLGRATLAALEQPPQVRVRQLELALERLRLTPVPAARRFITVNLPEFVLRAWERDEDGRLHEQLTMRVIVGKAPAHKTPLFEKDMRWIEFSPYWNIPPSIARSETLPKLRANPGYLAAQGMEFVALDGTTSIRADADMLQAVAAGQWRVRQRPGPRNALGDIKFMLPNAHHIYLHHTPDTHLFQRARRDFSHGCIRLEEPVALALWVLAGAPEWTEERIRQAMGRTQPLVATLPEPVPVLMVYQGVSVQQGQAVFLPDVYGLDARLGSALQGH